MKLHKISSILIFFIISHYSHAQWQQVNSNSTSNLVDIRFVSDSIGYAISNSGQILRTVDEGNNWVQVDSLPGTFTCLANVGVDTIYAGGNKIYRSVDGGNSWTLINTPGYTIPDLEFFDGKNGIYINPYSYVCTSSTGSVNIADYKVCNTTDSGATWQTQISSLDPSSRLQLSSDSSAYVTWDYHIIQFHCAGPGYNAGAKTSNKGMSWTGAPAPGTFYSIFYLLNDTLGYFIGGLTTGSGSGLWKMTGSLVSLVTSSTVHPGQLIFINEIDGYTLSAGNIYMSTSGGMLWNLDTIPAVALNKIWNDHNKAMFAIGQNGVILKKQIIESLYPDTVYAWQANQTALGFDTVMVGASKIKQLTIHNAGTVPLNVTVSSTDTFRVSTLNNIYSNSIALTIPPQYDSVINVKFLPLDTLFYQDTLVIQADSVPDIFIPLSGLGTDNLIGQLFDSLYLCRDTINVVGNFTINNGGKLVICPGTVVYFKGNYSISVSGTLIADGLPPDSIWFTAEDKVIGWDGIHFNTTTNSDSSIIRFCVFNYQNYQYGFIINSSDRSNLIIDHSYIYNTSGAIYASNSSIIISNNKIFNNVHTGNPGCAIKLFYDGSLIINNEIFNNTSGDGAGIWALNTAARYPKILQNTIFNNTSNGNSGAVYIAYKKAHFQNNIVCNNKGSSIGGVRFWAIDSVTLGLNNIIYGNSGIQLDLYASPNVFIGYSDIQGGYSGGINNIDFDPYFVNSTDSVGVMTNIGNYDWSLQSTSPCIDAGDTTYNVFIPQFDFIGNPRIYNNTRIDIGAYEYQGVIGINEMNVFASVFILPNPFHTSTTLQFPNTLSNATLQIYNTLGSLVKQQTISGQSAIINREGLKNGIYFIRVSTDEGEWAGKVIIE